MRLLSESSYCRLTRAESDLAELRDRHRELVKRHRELESAHQRLILAVGLKGFEVEGKAAVPAKAVLKKVRTTV